MSIDRVKEFAEVYTSEKDVNDMLDIVNEETLRIDSRFLEPACGNGNFLVQVLIRKINVITKRYKNSKVEFERYIVQAISSLYGIDILKDNVEMCRKRLFDLVIENYNKIYEKNISQKFIKTIKYILSFNIVWGDALSLLDQESKQPIIFAEWSFVTGSLIKRTDYIFSDLIAYQPFEKDTLFSDLGEKVIIPDPKYSYKPIHYLDLEKNVKEKS
tara:strand:- start:2771 stop:3415 length:645 start_codon:yes stop_codon:yes gene_type:complete